MRPASRSRVAAAVLAVPALLVGVAACGTADTQPLAAQATSPSSRWDEKTIVPAMKAAIEKQESVHVAIRASGESRPSMNAEGDVALGGKRPDLVFTMDKTPMGGSGEVRVVDGVAYVSMPPMTPKGKFVEIRLDDRSSRYGRMGPMRGFDPDDGFGDLKSALREVTYVGSDTVHGQPVGHYRLTVDPRAAARSGGMPHAYGDMPHGYGRGPRSRVPRTVKFDVWLDDQALVHRVELDRARRGSVVVDLTDWGKPVTVKAPPDTDVVERGTGQWRGMHGWSRSYS